MKKILIILIILSSVAYAESELPRPDKWAQKISLSGVGNLYKVTDNLYRSQQPTADGFNGIKNILHARTVINLRAFHSDRKNTDQQGLLDEELSMKTWHIEDEDVIRVLKILRDKGNGPFLIHCQHGADRTGVVIAMFRIVEQGWSKDEAVEEMVQGGYGFHPIWSNIIEYIRNADIENIREQLGDPMPINKPGHSVEKSGL